MPMNMTIASERARSETGRNVDGSEIRAHIVRFTAPAVLLGADNVDTDQIIPARYLTTTDKTGLGDKLFSDWRYDASGEPKPDFVLNRPEARTAQVLVAGINFGCGSSREHAPWALVGFGFRAVVARDFADIFRNNALKNSLLPVAIDAAAHERLVAALTATPGASVTVDLETQTLTLPDGTSASFPVDAFAKHCLLTGVDELGFLLTADSDIRAYEAGHPGWIVTTSVEAH
jgi:3-isopropylmalate/(R)-2-methylmalate dehydratase small subunit